MRTFNMILAVACLTAGTISAEDKAAAKEEKITFDQHILPIFREKCGSCHNSNDKKGDLVLDNYGMAMQGGASGEVVRTDGDASQSQLYLVVTHMAEPKMPPQQPKLPDEQLALIRKWIEGGSLENAGSKAKPKKNMSVTQVVVSNQRPAGPPPMPENLPLDPVVVGSRGNGVTALAVNPWSPLAAVAGHKQVTLHDTRTRDLLGVLPFPEGVAQILKFSRNGQWLLAGGGRGGQSGKVVIWEVKTGKRIAEVGGEYDAVLAADISPDHTQIALGGPKRVVRVYDTSTGELLYEKTKHTDWITAIEFSPDGVLLATGDRSNGLWVWEAFTGREFYGLTGHTAAITDVSWSADSNLLASSSEDTTIRLWEMQNGGQIKNWGAHGGGVTSIEMTRDNRIASTGRDNVAKLWDLNGKALQQFGGLGDIGMEVAFDSDLDYLLAGDLTGQTQVWNAKDASILGQLSSNVPELARQVELTTNSLTPAEGAATQAAANLAAITKTIADRKAGMEAAVKVQAEAATELDLLTKIKALADADVAAKTRSLQSIEMMVANTQAAVVKATAERDEATKAVTDARARFKAHADAIVAAEAESGQALAAYEAKPADANLKAAHTAAVKKLTDALAMISELSKQSTATAIDHTSKSEALITAMTAANNAKNNFEKAGRNKAASEETAARTAAKHQIGATAKANADKSVSDLAITPELQKQLADAEAAAKSTADKVAAIKAHLERLNAAKGRSLQSLEASVK